MEEGGSRETRELGTDRQPHITTQQKRKSFVDLLGFNKEENILYLIFNASGISHFLLLQVKRYSNILITNMKILLNILYSLKMINTTTRKKNLLVLCNKIKYGTISFIIHDLFVGQKFLQQNYV